MLSKTEENSLPQSSQSRLSKFIDIFVEDEALRLVKMHEKAEKALDAADMPNPPRTPRPTYPQKWEAYNAAQVEEKILFLDLLEDLTACIEWQQRPGRGRPQADLREMAFACVCKVYEGLSARRLSSDLELAKRRGYLTETPHFNTVLKFLNNPELTPILYRLIELSALPLRDFETTFAVDATGLSSAFYSRWLDYRFNEDRRFHDWIKVHAMCGVKTHIVSSIVITDGHSSDSPHFPSLLSKTAKHFTVREVCADLGYSGRENVAAAWDAGVLPLIPFKKNASGRSKGHKSWRRMYHYFQMNKEDFYERYHQRSNVESTFSALKRKFNGKLMLKSEVGKVNEALCKVLCHNLCVLIAETHKMGLKIDFPACTQIQGPAHLMPSA